MFNAPFVELARDGRSGGLPPRAQAVEVARQLGHSPTMSLDTYGHVFDELQGTDRLSAEEQIRRGPRQVSVRFVSAAEVAAAVLDVLIEG
jgi:hypothetical protein